MRTENNCTTFSNKTSTYNSKQQGDAEPTGYVPYSGKVTNIPTRVSTINQLPVAKLREILHYHGFSIMGSKDQLVIRVYLLRQGQTAAIMAKEEEQIKEFTKMFHHAISASTEEATT